MKIELLPIETVREAPFNPALRTLPHKMKELRDSIEEHGIEVPLIIGSYGVLGDGHRRLACARELGLEVVPVVRSKTRTSWDIYADNSTQRPTRASEWLQAVVKGFPIDMVPIKHRRHIADVMRVHPRDELIRMANIGQSPTIINFARRVGRHIGDTSDPMLRKIDNWFIKHGVQYKTRKAIEDGCTPDTVFRAIEEDRPIMVVYQ